MDIPCRGEIIMIRIDGAVEDLQRNVNTNRVRVMPGLVLFGHKPPTHNTSPNIPETKKKNPERNIQKTNEKFNPPWRLDMLTQMEQNIL